MITVSTLTTGSSGTPSTQYVTASVSPSGDALLLFSIAVYVSSGSTNANTPTVTGNGLTWELVDKVDADATGTDRSSVFVFRSMGSSPSSGTITVDFVGSNQGRACWFLDQATGVNTSGSNGSGAIAQSKTGISSGSVLSLSTSFNSSISTGNVGWAAYHVESVAANVFTAGSGWTTQSTSNGQNYSLVYSEIETSDNAIAASWDTSGRAGLVAVEVAASPSAIPAPWITY